MSHYHDPSDQAFDRSYITQTPDIAKAFGNFDAAVFATEGRVLPLKVRELMAVATALTTQCVYCIEFHSRRAVESGASEAELAETAWVVTALRGGAAFSHGRLAFKFGSDGGEG